MAGPSTKATGQAIVAYLSNLTYQVGGNVYTLAQLDQIKDLTDQIATGGACAEVYGDEDSATGKVFQGGQWDEQTWVILSTCSLATNAYAIKIYDVRDAMVQPFASHYELGNTIPGIFWSRLVPKSGRFVRIDRNGQWVMAHLIRLETKVAWQPATFGP